jgi:hypothetical protein
MFLSEVIDESAVFHTCCARVKWILGSVDIQVDILRQVQANLIATLRKKEHRRDRQETPNDPPTIVILGWNQEVLAGRGDRSSQMPYARVL